MICLGKMATERQRRPRQIWPSVPRSISVALVAFALWACGSRVEVAPDADWRVYLGDVGRTHYSPLAQIDRGNVAELELAWVYDSGEPATSMYTSPLVVDGVFYALSPQLAAFALDAATGEEIWRRELDVVASPQRGLMWWEKGDDKRIYFTSRRHLIALNAADGTLVADFGDGGMLDLTPTRNKREGAGTNYRVNVDYPRPFYVTVPGVVFEDLIILGFSTSEWEDAFPGAIRAFNAVNGDLAWQFDTVPAPGAPGSETWAEGALANAGGANVWTGMALDEARGILFAPTGSATPDFLGAGRLGDNLYANCLLALDVNTGELLWHYQVVRHDLWDRDNASPPTLVQVERDGRKRDAVALATKSGHLYLFDRETGESLYPIVEVDSAVPSSIPGEAPAPTQRFSSVAFSRQQFEITNRTPEARAFVEDAIADFDLRLWAPPRVGTVLIQPWYDGGAGWGGAAFDPATSRLILNAHDVAGTLELSEVPAGSSDYGSYAKHCGSCHGADLEGTDVGVALQGLRERLDFRQVRRIVNGGKGRMPGFAHLSQAERTGILRYVMAEAPVKDEPTADVSYAFCCYTYLRDDEGLPGNAPPWGTLNSFDLASGEIVWSVPFGDFPTHPDLGFGAISYGGPVVTASGLIFIAATPDAKLRAYDERDGAVLWETELSAAGFSTPAVYAVAGKQYVAIAAGGGRSAVPSGADYVAFSLP